MDNVGRGTVGRELHAFKVTVGGDFGFIWLVLGVAWRAVVLWWPSGADCACISRDKLVALQPYNGNTLVILIPISIGSPSSVSFFSLSSSARPPAKRIPTHLQLLTTRSPASYSAQITSWQDPSS